MSFLKEFDNAIATIETQNGIVARGYVIGESRKDYYLSNESWRALKCGMDAKHLAQYNAGGGKELEEKDGKPPKMAAFASSSRMIYNISKEIPDFVFEKKLPTTVGGTANLDGYLEKTGTHIFVEAKCREPYGHKEEQTIKQNYRGIYAWLREKMPRVFSCVMENMDNNEMQVAFFCRNKIVAHFDIKQMICHMLGIATELLKNPDEKSILFLYLFYNPKGLPLGGDAACEIQTIYADTCWAAEHYRFEEMFGHVVDYLVQEKGIAADEQTVTHLKNAFRFELCDQDAYGDYLK